MILQALLDYYETLAAQGRITRPGWTKVKVSWALEIDENGKLLDVLPLRHLSDDGKKLIPLEMELPAPVKRAVGISPNFLCDNATYILGADNKGRPARSKECFAEAARLHSELLDSVDHPAAGGLLRFFGSWKPERIDDEPALLPYKEELLSGDNITFIYDGRYVCGESAIQAAWQKHYDDEPDEKTQRCLITGRKTASELVHPAIKNVRGAQSSGAALVSFNAPAYCSFGKEQNANAPVSKYAAFAYTSALNALLADRRHVKQIGNTTVVYWAKDAGTQYQDTFAALFDGSDDSVTDAELTNLMEAVASGRAHDFEGLPVHPENEFYILGISPNAARLAVRFFYRSSFGELVGHLKAHYADINIASDNRSKWHTMPLWALLRETVNLKSSDKSPLPQMSGDVMRSMISGGRYPETLMNQTMLRIRAERDITRGRAGIVKAYLIRNTENHPDRDLIQEVSTVSLNAESQYTPYVLGRLFAVLEGTQQAANPGINATIKDRFFNSACATPAAAFPILLKLSNSHLKKMDSGKAVYWSRQIGELMERLSDGFPTHLSLQEQGSFILGYYHQTRKRYEKKNNDNDHEEDN